MSDSNLSRLPSIAQVIKRDQLAAKKTLGQNFLTDINLTKRIAHAAQIQENDTIVEIGPGPGALTRALLLSPAKKVIVIEKDHRFLPALHELQAIYPDKLTILQGDALKMPLSTLSCEGALKVVANLPYNIGTQLLLNWQKERNILHSITVMLQKEVAERLIATPNTKAYGRLSILMQWLFIINKQFDVSPKAFTPPPKVTSSIVSLTPRLTPLYAATQAHLERLTGIVFQQRRKMLRSSLKGLHPDLEGLLTANQIDPESRPETLSIEDFCRLSRLLFAT